MKLNKGTKSGISLIVLVITIIVMIILAAAIILSLNSSGIIGKANKATTDSDAANKKEAASIKLAEYELAKQMGELEDPTQTANEYVKEELEKDGIDTSDMAITEDGEVLTGLTEIAVKFVEAGVKIGAEVTGYTLDTSDEAKTYTTSGNENTCDPDDYQLEKEPQPVTIIRDESITWKYFGIDEKGEAVIVGSVTDSSPEMTLGGKGGYLNGSQELKEACEAMYSSDMGTGRSITIEDVTRVLEYTGERGAYWDPEYYEYTPTKEALTISQISSNEGGASVYGIAPEDGKSIYSYKSDNYEINKEKDVNKYNTDRASFIYLEKTYWLASSSVFAYFGIEDVYFYMRYVSNTLVGGERMYDADIYYFYSTFAVRPVVTLTSEIQMTYENGVVTIGLE